MSNVIQFSGDTRLDIDPDKVLEGAKGELKSVLVIGECKDNDGRHWFASSTTDAGQLLWLIETFKHKLMAGDFGGDE